MKINKLPFIKDLKRDISQVKKISSTKHFKKSLPQVKKISFIVIPVIVVLLFTSIFTRTGLATGLDLNDQTANGHNFTNNGATEVTTSLPFSAETEAVSFDGTDDYLTTPNTSDLSVPTTGKLTIEFWAKASSLSDNNIVISKGTSSNWEYRIMFGDASGRIQYNVFSLDGNNRYYGYTNGSIISTGTWYHVAYVIDDSGSWAATNVKVYLNGSPVTWNVQTGGSTYTLANGSAPFEIGRYSPGSLYFNGVVDDVQVWNTARTSTQISNDYSSPALLAGTESGLVAYWPFQTIVAPTATPTPTPTPTPAPYDGWNSANQTWTYASATTITVPSDATTVYSPGDKIRLKQGGSYKYFYVTGVSSTTLTVTGGSDYSVANSTITDNYYSKADTPVGFPQYFNYSPTWSGTGTMTFTPISPPNGNIAQFSITGRTVHVLITEKGTTGGNASYGIIASLPVTPSTIYNSGYNFSAGGADIDQVGGNDVAGTAYVDTGYSSQLVFNPHSGNLPLSTTFVLGTSYSYAF